MSEVPLNRSTAFHFLIQRIPMTTWVHWMVSQDLMSEDLNVVGQDTARAGEQPY